jgi:hypothetical protein
MRSVKGPSGSDRPDRLQGAISDRKIAIVQIDGGAAVADDELDLVADPPILVRLLEGHNSMFFGQGD